MMYDLDQTIELLQRAVAEKGDGHVYERHKDELGYYAAPSCRYSTQDGKPDCIVGHVLNYAGLLSPKLDEQGSVAALDVVPPNFTEMAVKSLIAAQLAQDSGKTWGEALVAAKEAIIEAETVDPWDE